MPSKWNRVKNYFKLTGEVYVGVFLSLGLSYLMSYVFPLAVLQLDNDWLGLPVFIFFLAAFYLPSRYIVRFIRASFRRQSNKNQLVVITHTYFGVVVIFAALFFDFNIIGDFWNQLNASEHFLRVEGTKSYSPKYPIYPIAEHRAFKGFPNNLWTGVLNPDYEIMSQLPASDIDTGICYRCSFDDFVDGQISGVPIDLSYNLAKQKIEPKKLYKFQRRYVLDNFGECLYFSVITIATVGYGDISPQTWYAKLAVAMEVLAGLIIFVFAVNFLFLSWNSKQTA